MPVDKFGRDNSIQSNISSGVSVRYVNNNFLRRDGTNNAVGPLNMDSNRISNVVNPVADQDVATKSYVDGSVGGTNNASGNLDMARNRIENLPFNPVDTNDAASAAFVINGDLAVEDKALFKDGTKAMTGHLNMNHHYINNVLDPAYDQDVATKSYVDTKVTSVQILGGSRSGHCQFGWDSDGFTINIVDGSTTHKIMTLVNGRMTGLTNPIHDSDATTKEYVDEAIKRMNNKDLDGTTLI